MGTYLSVLLHTPLLHLLEDFLWLVDDKARGLDTYKPHNSYNGHTQGVEQTAGRERCRSYNSEVTILYRGVIH